MLGIARVRVPGAFELGEHKRIAVKGDCASGEAVRMADLREEEA